MRVTRSASKKSAATPSKTSKTSKKRKAFNAVNTTKAVTSKNTTLLPAIGTHVFKDFEGYKGYGKRFGRVVAMVMRHGQDALGPFAEAKEMNMLGVSQSPTPVINNNNNNGPMSYIEVGVVPRGVKPSGKTYILRTHKKNEFVSQVVSQMQNRTLTWWDKWRPLPYGQKVYDFVSVKTKKYDSVREKAAKGVINRFRARQRKARSDPLVKAALNSYNKFVVNAHGSLGRGEFTVPVGMCIVFVTAPGALAWYNSDVTIDDAYARQLISGGIDGRYSAPYFAGDTVGEHRLDFHEKYNGIYELPYTFKHRVEKANMLITGDNTRFASILRGTKTRLSEFVQYMKTSTRGSASNPVVLIMSTCRSGNVEGKSLREIRKEFERNWVGRNRVGAFRVKLPETVVNAKRMGESQFLRDMLDHHNPQYLKWIKDSGGVV